MIIKLIIITILKHFVSKYVQIYILVYSCSCSCIYLSYVWRHVISSALRGLMHRQLLYITCQVWISWKSFFAWKSGFDNALIRIWWNDRSWSALPAIIFTYVYILRGCDDACRYICECCHGNWRRSICGSAFFLYLFLSDLLLLKVSGQDGKIYALLICWPLWQRKFLPLWSSKHHNPNVIFVLWK